VRKGGRFSLAFDMFTQTCHLRKTCKEEREGGREGGKDVPSVQEVKDGGAADAHEEGREHLHFLHVPRVLLEVIFEPLTFLVRLAAELDGSNRVLLLLFVLFLQLVSTVFH